MSKEKLTENNFHDFLRDTMGVTKSPQTKEDVKARFRELAGMDESSKENNNSLCQN